MESNKLRCKDGRRKTAQLRPKRWQKQRGRGGGGVLGGSCWCWQLAGDGKRI